MKRTESRRTILELASEDYIGLWEVRWAIQQAQSDAPESSLFTDARALIREMIEDGALMLYSGTHFAGEESVVPQEEVSSLLEVELYWNEPISDHPQLRVVATERGEGEYIGNTGSA